MSENTGTIWRKLMRDALDEKERQRLLCHPKVEERMRSQWDEATGGTDPAVRDRMWEQIIARTMATKGAPKLRVYKITAIAASLLLLLSLANIVYRARAPEDRYIHVMACGVRCIEPVYLSDGTRVSLGPNSQLIYPKSFDGKTRHVQLKGEPM